VLLDIGLPGMDGWEVARRIKERAPEKAPCLIVISGYGREEDVEHSHAEGIALHLRKPVDPDTLERLLKESEKQIRGAEG
jgi:CheY-like chemotaxis protein